MTGPEAAPSAFAYLVPLNPYAPHRERWATLVREERLQVGDRISLGWTETTAGDPGEPLRRVSRMSPHAWEVAAVETTGDEGKHAAIRGWPLPGNAPRSSPVWDGRLVLEQVE
jgi:hypothetical protein